MKKIKLILCVVAATSLGFVSCNNDDDSDAPVVVNPVAIAGTYNLTAANTGNPTDFNEDGTENTNQLLESTCYAGNKMVFNADGSFAWQMNNILVDSGTGNSACDDYLALGTWTLESGTGTSAVINVTYEAENGEDVDITLNKTGTELQWYSLLGPYPDKNDDGGAFNQIGEFELLFTKQ
ncbi:hypothetical protein [Flavobacterium sp.]|uniref:hypothetical protein n=1 Tax=Flavobacterium sp. TaxID=239 RepID=UPI0039E22BBC